MVESEPGVLDPNGRMDYHFLNDSTDPVDANLISAK
jgi:hypothetical protein